MKKACIVKKHKWRSDACIVYGFCRTKEEMLNTYPSGHCLFYTTVYGKNNSSGSRTSQKRMKSQHSTHQNKSKAFFEASPESHCRWRKKSRFQSMKKFTIKAIKVNRRFVEKTSWQAEESLVVSYVARSNNRYFRRGSVDFVLWVCQSGNKNHWRVVLY